jgi:shikimate kinase
MQARIQVLWAVLDLTELGLGLAFNLGNASVAIVLTGLSGSGKTSVGTALSELLGWTFIDTDSLIEVDYGSTIAEIFSSKGEPFFRGLETRILEKLAADLGRSRQNCVVSTGGGAVISEHNRKILKSLGKVVFLSAPIEVLAARLSGDTTRPLLNSPSANLDNQADLANLANLSDQLNICPQTEQMSRLILKLENLLSLRENAYKEADLVVDTSELESVDIANRIQDLLNLAPNRL